MLALLTVALCAGTSPFEPLDDAAIVGFTQGPSAPAPLQRLARYEAAARETDASVALGMFEGLGTDQSPLAVAARFHATRLAVALGRPFVEDLEVLLGSAPADRPAVRWGIRRSEQGALLLAIADRRQREGDAARARQLRLLAAMRFPRHAPLPVGATRTERREYAEAHLRDMDYGGGVDLLTALLSDADADEHLSVQRRIAQVRADLMRDDYPKVVALVRDIIARTNGGSPEDVMMLAYALGKVDPDRAVQAYRTYLERFPAGPAREEAAFFIPWTDFDREHFDAAVTGFDAFVAAYPEGVFRHAARWYRGLCRYRLGRLDAALEDFRYTERNGRERDKGTYWTARVLADKKDVAAARARYERLARADPFGYYGLLARARLGSERQAPDFRQPRALRAPEDAARLAKRFAAIPNPLREQLTEALAIAQLGRVDLSAHLLRHLVQDHPTALGDGPLLAELQRRCGDFAGLARGAEAERCRTALAGDPRDPATRYCWNTLYPRAYARTLEEVGATTPPELVWAIMRQESFYQPNARSVADALGLMQLIPQLAEPAARALGEVYEPYEATRPGTNLRWFAAGTRSRYEQFGGHLPLFLMSYNATPAATMDWLQDNRDLPFDLFVEEISFKETRDYVKRIAGHMARYAFLARRDGPLHEGAGLAHPDRIAAEVFAAALRPTTVER